MRDLRIITRKSRFGVALTLTTTNEHDAPHQTKLGVLTCNTKQAEAIVTMLIYGGPRAGVTVESGAPSEMRKERNAFGSI
jgi:hypothetical protein